MLIQSSHTRRTPGLLTALTLTALTGLALVAKPAQAATDFTFTLSNPDIVAPAGSSVVYDGTVTFISTPINPEFGAGYTNGTYVSGFGLDPSYFAFLTSSPQSGSTYTGALADYSIAVNAPNGASAFDTGYVEIVDDSGQITIPITLTVGPAAVTTPEPASYAAFAMGGLGLIGLGLKTRMIKARKRNA